MASYQFLTPTKVKLFVEKGYRDDGSRARKTKTVSIKTPNSERAAQKALDDFIEYLAKQKDDGEHLEKITFSVFAQRWMDMYVKQDLALRTAIEYQRTLNRGLLEFFGSMKLDKIKTFHVVKFFTEEKEAGKRGQRGKYICLKSIFSTAVKWGVISKSPMMHVDPKKDQEIKREIKFYNDEQLAELLKALDEKKVSAKLRVIIKLACLVGLREGEIAGLLKRNINFNNNTILIDRQLLWDKDNKRFVMGPVKYKRPRRVNVPIKFMQGELKKYVHDHNKLAKICDDTWYQLSDPSAPEDPLDLLFTSSKGRPHHPIYLSNAWRQWAEKNGLPSLNFHGLRHTYASHLLNTGVNIQYIKEQLGHSNVLITTNTYTHTDMNAKQEQISNAFDAFL